MKIMWSTLKQTEGVEPRKKILQVALGLWKKMKFIWAFFNPNKSYSKINLWEDPPKFFGKCLHSLKEETLNNVGATTRNLGFVLKAAFKWLSSIWKGKQLRGLKSKAKCRWTKFKKKRSTVKRVSIKQPLRVAQSRYSR